MSTYVRNSDSFTTMIGVCHEQCLPMLRQSPIGDQGIQQGQVALGGERKHLYPLGLPPLAITLISPNRGQECIKEVLMP